MGFCSRQRESDARVTDLKPPHLLAKPRRCRWVSLVVHALRVTCLVRVKSVAVAPFYFEHIVKATFGIGPPDREALKAKVADLLKYAKVLDGHLAGRTYVACQRLTIADFQMASMATDWRDSEMPLTEFPNIVGWLDGLMRVPAWAHPWPDRPTGAGYGTAA